MWGDYFICMFCGIDCFFWLGYNVYLLESWILFLMGVEEKLKVGVKVVDIVCGYGFLIVLFVKVFLNFKIYGFDFYEFLIE